MIAREAGPGKMVLAFDSPKDLAAHMARSFADHAAQCVREQGSFFAALSGGITPADFLRELAALRDQMDFEKIHLFQADERMVPPDHAESNQAMIRKIFVEPAGFPADRFHPVPVDAGRAALAAQAYESAIKGVLESAPFHPKGLDLILLGVGQDGHTASLFPDDPGLQSTGPWTRAARSVRHAHERVTLSLGFVAASQRAAFMITGAEKADIVREILLEQSPALPASLVWKSARQAVMALDLAAARTYLELMA